jgi:hypothetical protein
MAAILKYRLDSRASYKLGEPVDITFFLENLSNQTVWVLKWYTPLEGIKGKIFELVCDGQTILYRGRMVKRGEPKETDYLRVPSGGSVAATVNLCDAYTLSECRECRLKFSGEILDVIFGEQLTLSPGVEPHTIKVSGNAVTFKIVS